MPSEWYNTLHMPERDSAPSHEPVLDWSVEEALERGFLVPVSEEQCEWARLPVTVRLSQAVDEQLLPTQEQEEQGEDAEAWILDVLSETRKAIERANPWDNRTAFAVTLAGRTLDLCVTLDTTCGRALHILTAEEAQR
jgi:hypothetical protein